MTFRTPVRTLCVLTLAAFAAACESSTESAGVDTVVIEAEGSELGIGDTLQLTATAYDEDGDEVTGRAVTWTSSNPGVATISGNGVLTGVAAGSVAITAQIGGEFDTQTFDVVQQASCPVTPYTLGTTITGTLSATDCALDDGTFFDFYTFTVATSRSVTVTMSSTAVNSYLFLLSSSIQVIAEDDNSGGGQNARITATLAPGTYVIAANSFNVATGSYTLTSQ